MSSSKWFAAAAAALMALSAPAALAGDRARVQITIAPYWGWAGPVLRPAPRVYGRGHHDGYRDARTHGYYGGSYGGGHSGPYAGYYGGPVIRFDYRDRGRDRYYGHGGYRPGGHLRYDSRRDRDYYRDERRHHGRDRHD